MSRGPGDLMLKLRIGDGSSQEEITITPDELDRPMNPYIIKNLLGLNSLQLACNEGQWFLVASSWKEARCFTLEYGS